MQEIFVGSTEAGTREFDYKFVAGGSSEVTDGYLLRLQDHSK
jgi:hypothetical protein